MTIFNKKNWILLKELVKTDFKLRYQESAIGYLWSILRPLLLFAVMYLVFIRFLRFGQGTPHFAVAMLLGTVVWGFFGEATNRSLFSIVSRGGLLRKINFPKTLVILSEVIGALINFGINLVVVLIFILANGVGISWQIVFIIPLTIELLLVTMGVSFILATVYVSFRDIAQIWEVVMQAGFYATPIIYPISMLLTKGKDIAALAKYVLINPLAQIIQDFRSVMIVDKTQTYQTTLQFSGSLIITLIPILLSLALFIFGLMLFNKKSARFAEIV